MILIIKALNILSVKITSTKLKRNIIFALMCFVMKKKLVYPVHMSNERFENCIALLMITDENKSYMSVSKISTDL